MASPNRTGKNFLSTAAGNSLKAVEHKLLPEPRPILKWMAKRKRSRSRSRSRARVVVVGDSRRKKRGRVSPVDGEEIVESKKEHNLQDSHMDVNEVAHDATCHDSDGNTVGVLKILEERSRLANAKQIRITFRIYNMLHLRATQVEKTRAEKRATSGSGKKALQRPDLKALAVMAKLKALLHPEKIIGSFPGLNVGHKFFSRAEMVSIGLHSHSLKGIDFVDKVTDKRKIQIKTEWPRAKLPIATAIVMSGCYEDDVDKLDELIYTGQGGNDLRGDRRQYRDQRVFDKSNLSLKNSMEGSTPVRVIRGHMDVQNKYGGKFYTYDGLYNVTDFWTERGHSGFMVCKYKLQRLVGQPKLTISNKVQFVQGGGRKVDRDIPLICQDISNGLERIRVPASNIVDKPPRPPTKFTYISRTIVSKDVPIPYRAKGCSCVGSCTDHQTCACAKKNGSKFPYVSNRGVRLVQPVDVVYECGPQCACGPQCINRASQQGLQYNLEVFKTASKGWGCRSWDYIPAGAFICEYVGKLKRNDHRIEHLVDNTYILELDLVETMKGLEGRKKRVGDVVAKFNGEELRREFPKYVIDAQDFGNVSRFLNHSCDPNVFIQCVLSSHDDFSLPRIAMFAADHIHPLEELSYDYGFAVNSVVQADGTIKKMPCYCGAAECRKQMF